MSWLATASAALVPSFAGWRTMILITGLAAVLAGIAAWLLLTDSPQKARWLTGHEKTALQEAIAREEDLASDSSHSILAGLKNPKVLLLSLAFFSLPFGVFSLTFFLPSIVAGFRAHFGIELSAGAQAGLNALPWVCAIIGALVFSRLADRAGRPGVVTLVGGAIGAAGAVGAALAENPYALIAMLSVTAFGLSAIAPTVFAVVPKVVAGVAAAAAIALVNSLGSIGGFVGPYLTGFFTDLTGTQDVVYYLMAALLLVAGIIALTIDNHHRRCLESASTHPLGRGALVSDGRGQ
jgi:MFS family permease